MRSARYFTHHGQCTEHSGYGGAGYVKRFRACTEWHCGLCTPLSTIGDRAHCCQSGCRRYSTMFGLYTRAHPIEKQFRGTPRHTHGHTPRHARTHAHTSTHIPTHIPTHPRTHNSYRPPCFQLTGSSLRPHFSDSEASQMPPPPRPGGHAPLGHLTSSHGASSSAGPLPGSRTGKARDACAWCGVWRAECGDCAVQASISCR